MSVDVDAVSRVIEEAARTLVLPRFTRLSVVDVEAKPTPGNPADLVTVVDREVEAQLSRALTALEPSARVVGEEGAHQHPELLQLLGSDEPIWIIDPLDGTRNFASGDSRFGIMVAYVMEGRAQAAWVVLPITGQTFVAETGAGAFINGERVRVASTRRGGSPRGAVLSRYMPDGLGEAVTGALRGRVRLQQPSGCAAIEYTDIVEGRGDFAIYYRLLAWDHAAPALILTEAGGRVAHLDGRAYTPRSRHQPTIVARDGETADQLCDWLRAGRAIPGV